MFAPLARAFILGIPCTLILVRAEPEQAGGVGIIIATAIIMYSAAAVMLGAAITLARHEPACGRKWPWIVLIVVFAAGSFSLQPFAIPTSAMEPMVVIGDRILVETIRADFKLPLHRGDVSRFATPLIHGRVLLNECSECPEIGFGS